jgi:hypothetical protein
MAKHIANALVTVTYRLNIPEERLQKIAEVEHADSFEAALEAVDEWVRDNLPYALEYAADEPEVEADA